MRGRCLHVPVPGRTSEKSEEVLRFNDRTLLNLTADEKDGAELLGHANFAPSLISPSLSVIQGFHASGNLPLLESGSHV